MKRRCRKASGRPSAGRGWRRSPLAAFAIAFALLVQLFAAAAPPPLAAPVFARADNAAVAAGIRAMFGDAAKFCVHVEDQSAPGKHAPSSGCCDQCPLCRFAAQAVAFVPPRLPALPERLGGDADAFRPSPSRDVLPAYPARANPARAPPLAV